MADNTRGGSESGTAPLVASDEVTHSGDTADVQLMRPVLVTGSEGSKTVVDLPGDNTNGLDVDVTRVQGTVTVDGSGFEQPVGHTALTELAAAIDTELQVDVVGALPAGNNNIGDVDVASLPALVAGSANIGDVDVLTLPADPLGANADAIVAAGAVGSISAKLRRLTQGIEDLKTSIVLAAGSANIGDVDVLTLPGVGGLAAHASPVSGNPLFIAGRASAVIPTDVGADGDAAGMWTNRSGAQMVSVAPHVGLNSDPWNLLHEGVRYTSAQTSTVVVAGGASEKIVVTKVQLATEGTTAGTAILYFGTGAFARGTNRACFDGNFIPSATAAPGVVLDGPFIAGANGDDLMFTSVGAITIVVNVWYYVVT